MGRTWDHGDGFPDWEVLQSSVGPSRRSNPDQKESEVGCGGWLLKLQYAKWGTFLRSCVSIFAGYMSKICHEFVSGIRSDGLHMSDIAGQWSEMMHWSWLRWRACINGAPASSSSLWLRKHGPVVFARFVLEKRLDYAHISRNGSENGDVKNHRWLEKNDEKPTESTAEYFSEKTK